MCTSVFKQSIKLCEPSYAANWDSINNYGNLFLTKWIECVKSMLRQWLSRRTRIHRDSSTAHYSGAALLLRNVIRGTIPIGFRAERKSTSILTASFAFSYGRLVFLPRPTKGFFQSKIHSLQFCTILVPWELSCESLVFLHDNKVFLPGKCP